MKVLIFLVALALFVSPARAYSEEIKIGIVASGPEATIQVAAAQLAAHEAKQKTGLSIGVVNGIADCTAEKTRSVLNDLRFRDGAAAFVGDFCGRGVEAAARHARELQIPIVAVRPVLPDVLTAGAPWFFSEVLRLKRWSDALGDELRKRGIKDATIFAVSQPYAQIGVPLWKDAKKVSITRDVSVLRESDIKAQLAKIPTTAGLVIIGPSSFAASTIVEMAKSGFKPTTIATVLIPEPLLLASVHNLGVEILFPIYYPPDRQPVVDFLKRVNPQVDPRTDLSRFAHTIYRIKDAIDILAVVLKNSSARTPLAIRDALRAATATQPYSSTLSGI